MKNSFLISVKNLTKIYKTPLRSKNFIKDLFHREEKITVALDNVSFDVGDNELVALIGPNGAGKTTTLKILSGILYPDQGEVNVLGFTPFEKKAEFLKQIAFVMGQRGQTIWELPAIDSFQLTKEIYQVPDEVFEKNLKEMVSLFQVKKLIDRPIKTLSLGERMKMELINSLIYNPKIIFFDEPTLGLDFFSQEAIREFIRSYQKKSGATILLTSHYLEDIKRLAKRIIIINEGKILYDGELKKINHLYSNARYIKITLDKEIDPKLLEKIDRPIFYQFPKIIYRVAKDQLPEKISLINQLLPFSDMTIEEEKLEEIIKRLIRKK